MISILVIVIVTLFQSNHRPSACGCPPVPPQERTRWGNETIILVGETRVLPLRGKINDWNDGPLQNALVEIFTDPDVINLPYSAEVDARRAAQRRIAACFADDKGRFCLTGLRAGRYELRCSATNFKAVSQAIRIVAKGKVKKGITVHLPVAD
jgi:hypothetical protein